ncbi:uncharacterized protein [Choristoneura fumiferana]|uniref:uncharacterized protein n=1 Tax=Choristoneura fumiferana TaxID=7141 RepID=UPI003D15C242
MWYILLVVVTGTRCAHVARNDTDIVVTYEGHAEAVRPVPVPKSGTDTGTERTDEKVVVMSDTDSDYLEHSNVKVQNEPTEGPEEVVFIPSGNRDGGEYARRSNREREREFRVKDVMEKHTIGDIINDRVVQAETESPNEGILFISGKNNENMEQNIKKEEEAKINLKEVKEAAAPLDCRNLNCDHTLAAVCGVRLEQKKPRYRLFLNDCYFRKVNCGFSYEYNRYTVAPREKCATVGSHYPRRPDPPTFLPRPPSPAATGRREEEPPRETRRMMASRRALSTGVDGSPCSHPCPVHCPDDYTPECAITITAALSQQARVFLNHCQLDLHSCSTGSVWQRRPLADCVGNKKAEVQNNRAFIGWMQRVGIVDKKGRMVLA